jgi:hypothetical protein
VNTDLGCMRCVLDPAAMDAEPVEFGPPSLCSCCGRHNVNCDRDYDVTAPAASTRLYYRIRQRQATCGRANATLCRTGWSAAIPYPGSVFGVMANHDEPGVLNHCVGFARVKAALGAESRVR